VLRRRQRGIRAQVRRIWNAEAQRAVELADALVRQFGGWDRLWTILKPEQAAQVAARLAIASDEVMAKSEATECRNRAMVADAARDPATVATASRILLELPPRQLRPVLDRLILHARNRRACVMQSLGEGI
jgi:hypothetical protein